MASRTRHTRALPCTDSLEVRVYLTSTRIDIAATRGPPVGTLDGPVIDSYVTHGSGARFREEPVTVITPAPELSLHKRLITNTIKH